MKKFMRGLYLWVMYIAALPLVLVGMLALLGYWLYTVIRKEAELEDFGEWIKAIYAGAKEGHEINMYWVNTGETYSDKLLRESRES